MAGIQVVALARRDTPESGLLRAIARANHGPGVLRLDPKLPGFKPPRPHGSFSLSG